MASLENIKPETSESTIVRPKTTKLRQIQYRSYYHDIAIFHFQAYHVSVDSFRALLNRQEHGYVDTLVSFDPLARLKEPMPDGDVLSEGCVEVAYLASVFWRGGSALGFRMGNDVVHWLCFDQSIDESILKKMDIAGPDLDNKIMLFDHVGTLPKGVSTRRVTGSYPEHKGWYDSLLKAVHRQTSLKLTWRKYEWQGRRHAEKVEHE